MRRARRAALLESQALRPLTPPYSHAELVEPEPSPVWLFGLLCPHCGGVCRPEAGGVDLPDNRQRYVRCLGCGELLLISLTLTTPQRSKARTEVARSLCAGRDRHAPFARLIDDITAADGEGLRTA